MSADLLLSRLQGVRKYGKGWRANCPHGHQSKGTLSLTEADNGAVLLKCFAGCDTAAVLATLGLSLADLFPERIKATTPEQRRETRTRWLGASTAAAAAVVAAEGEVILIAGGSMARGEALPCDDLARLQAAVERVSACTRLLREAAA